MYLSASSVSFRSPSSFVFLLIFLYPLIIMFLLLLLLLLLLLFLLFLFSFLCFSFIFLLFLFSVHVHLSPSFSFLYFACFLLLVSVSYFFFFVLFLLFFCFFFFFFFFCFFFFFFISSFSFFFFVLFLFPFLFLFLFLLLLLRFRWCSWNSVLQPITKEMINQDCLLSRTSIALFCANMQKNNSDVHATATSEYMSVLMKHSKSKDRKTSLRAKTQNRYMQSKHMYMLKSWRSGDSAGREFVNRTLLVRIQFDMDQPPLVCWEVDLCLLGAQLKLMFFSHLDCRDMGSLTVYSIL